VKRFSFRLDRVLNLRRQELETAEARLHGIQFQREQARRGAASLGRQILEFHEQNLRLAAMTGAELRAAASYASHLSGERETLLQEERKWETDRQEQLQQVLEMRRKVRLIERLRERKERRHLEAASLELEIQATEAHLAKWVRERQREV